MYHRNFRVAASDVKCAITSATYITPVNCSVMTTARANEVRGVVSPNPVVDNVVKLKYTYSYQVISPLARTGYAEMNEPGRANSSSQ